MILVSVIVPYFKKKKFIEQTIKSILSQTYKNFEIIVVDGKSSDGTIKEIENKKNYFSKYIIEKDNGIYDAMNKGINFIDSDWTIFLNSGDTFFDNSTLFTVNSIDTNNYDIVWCPNRKTNQILNTNLDKIETPRKNMKFLVLSRNVRHFAKLKHLIRVRNFCFTHEMFATLQN